MFVGHTFKSDFTVKISCLEMIMNETQRGNGERARAEDLGDVARWVNECVCEYWLELSYPLYAYCATTVLNMQKNA